jgi:protoporphyrinogen oxidase
MSASLWKKHVAVVGGGFAGLSAAWELVKAGHRVTVIEADARVGGLAGSFTVGDVALEKFYHHWFTNDVEITDVVTELGLSENLVSHQSRTGMYYARSTFKLSNPADLLRFTPLPFIDRLRLGLLIPQARMVRDRRKLENVTAREWLLALCGPNVYRVVWEPLLRGKFGNLAEEIGAVWLWNKLCLRGGSRDKSGAEVLLYYKGGFAALASALESDIIKRGGTVLTGRTAEKLHTANGKALAVQTSRGLVEADAFIFTPALPICADLLDGHIDRDETARLRRVKYLANVCLVLRLDRSLSSLYWTNVNDPSFPFVGIIEHTNFEPASTYGGEHIVYLSRYLPASDPTYAMSDEEYLAYALPYLKKMFPAFDRAWLRAFHVWRADYAQPVVERNYASLIPEVRTSLENAYLCTMAQIYPEDRGTNYAVRSGRAVGKLVAAAQSHSGTIPRNARSGAYASDGEPFHQSQP